MRNVSVSVHNFTHPSLRDRCWKGRVKGKITSIAFFQASFADFPLPFQLCRIRSVYNTLVNPHFDYSRGVGIFLWVARPYESEFLKPIIFFYTNRPSDVNLLTKKASFLNLGGLRLGPGECGYEKMRFQQCGISMDWAFSSTFEGSCHALHNIAEVVLREARPPTPSYYSSYDVWYSRYVRTRLYACLSTSLYW